MSLNATVLILFFIGCSAGKQGASDTGANANANGAAGEEFNVETTSGTVHWTGREASTDVPFERTLNIAGGLAYYDSAYNRNQVVLASQTTDDCSFGEAADEERLLLILAADTPPPSSDQPTLYDENEMIAWAWLIRPTPEVRKLRALEHAAPRFEYEGFSLADIKALQVGDEIMGTLKVQASWEDDPLTIGTWAEPDAVDLEVGFRVTFCVP
jgi:hypothetical protein